MSRLFRLEILPSFLARPSSPTPPCPPPPPWLTACLPACQALMGFVNFKLYHELGLAYPPSLDPRLERAAAGESR